MSEEKKFNFPSYQEMYDRFIREGISEERADCEAKQLGLLGEEVKERFCHWWHTGELIDDLAIVGIRISSFTLKGRFRLPSAFIDFDEVYSKPLTTRTTITEDEEGYLTFLTRDISD